MVAVAGLVAVAASTAAFAQFTQQGPKLVCTPNAYANGGYSVALSADGNTALIGAPHYETDAGGGWIWRRSGGVWTLDTRLLGPGASSSYAPWDPFHGAWQGWAVALSADASIALVGGPGDHEHSGAVWLWTGGLSAPAKLVDPKPQVFSGFGSSVALSADGAVALIGSVNGAHVWNTTATPWLTHTLLSAKADAVALSADGNTAILGAEVWDDLWTWHPTASIWTRTGNVWTQQTVLVPSDYVPSTQASGSSDITVAISGDGNTAIIGFTGDNSGTGAAFVWVRSGTTWRRQGPKLVGSGATAAAWQGSGIALSYDGNTAIVGGFHDGGDFTGAAWVWVRSGEVWSEKQPKLVAPGTHALEGFSAALSADANTAIIGGYYDQDAIGAAWVWVSTPGDLSITETMTSGGRKYAGDDLGYDVHVINNGPGAVSSVRVSDVLPPGATFVSGTSSQGTCDHATAICAIGTLTSGASATLHIVVKTSLQNVGSVSNQVVIKGTENDPNPDNNSATATAEVIAPSTIPVASPLLMMELALALALIALTKR